MPKKKPSGTKKPVAKKKPAKKKAARKTEVKAPARTASNKKTRGKKLPRALKKGSSTPVSEIRSPEPSTLDDKIFARAPRRPKSGIGTGSGRQSGDLQGLSSTPDADSESVEELVEEGQSYEAGIVSGVEDALDADQGEVRTREIPADDVPREYTDED